MVTHAYNPRALEVEAEGFEVPNQFRMLGETVTKTKIK